MQNQIIDPGNLLKADGSLEQKGYSTRSVLYYNRENIKAAPWRVKEWDFYQINNDEYCIQMTIGHISYIGSVNVVAIDFKKGSRTCIETRPILPFNRLKMPRDAEKGDLVYKSKNFQMAFSLSDGRRRLYAKIDDPKQPSVNLDIALEQPDKSSIVMATPFDEDPHAFYYNHKINCMPASGIARIGGKEYRFDPEESFGLLDWGRGVWPFRHEWFWGSGSGWIDEKRFGFNIGYGFGNTSAATENMIFYDGVCHKIDEVKFNIPEDSYSKPWTFTSNDGRFEMDFVPVFDNYTEDKILFVNKHCHQVFGKFTGRATLDDGQVIEVKDIMAFAEHAVNQW
ncbi:MAG TPA: DUF2804 domain-containing protein [Clostridia bacterium]|nr:DUF2804 domain-containing protein [Clostridia bacterium]